MMNNIKIVVLLYALSLNFLAAQEKLVPVKLNNKFGLSTLMKDIKVEPRYDKIDFGIRPDYFTAFKVTKENGFSSTLYHFDKIILKDKPYFDYGIFDNLIIAADTTTQETVKYHNLFHNEKMHLYTKDGVLLTQKYYAFISIFEDASKVKPTLETMVLFRDLKNKFSIKVYDSEKQQFVRTLLENADDFDFVIDDQIAWSLESMKLTYTKGETYRKLEVKLTDGAFKVISDIKSSITKKPKQKRFYTDNYDIVEVPEENEKPSQPKQIPQNDSVTKSLKEVSIVKNHKNFIDTDYLYFESNWYNRKNYSLGYKNGKVGLIDNKKGEYILPNHYDNIYKVNYFLAFVIEKDGKYGLFFPYKNEIIEPIFKDFPIVVRKVTRNLGFNLIALFDVNSQKLKHYATFDGLEFVVE